MYKNLFIRLFFFIFYQTLSINLIFAAQIYFVLKMPKTDSSTVYRFMLTNCIFCIISISFWLTSCSKKPVDSVYFEFSKSQGFFVVNEGNFMYGNSSLSFVDLDNQFAHNQIFYARNAAPLGDVAQSVNIRNGSMYIMVNNSGKIYVADDNTMEFKGSITGLNSPRYLEFISEDKAYVSDLYSQSIHIISPLTYEKTGEINLEGGRYNRSSERLLLKGDTVFTNSWSNGKEILLINTRTDALVGSLEVGAQPQSMAFDSNGKLWVLCDGGYEGNPFFYEKPQLMRIDTRTMEIEKVFFFNLETSPTELSIHNDTLWFINRHIYCQSIYDSQLPDKPFISSPYPDDYGGFYALGIDPVTSHIFVADAIDHQQNGIVFEYNGYGELLNSYQVGVNPGHFWFKK